MAEPPDEPARDAYAEMADRDQLLGAVRRLDPDRRVVVALRYWVDLERPEIADLLEIPVGTASSRLARAITELRRHMEVTRR